MAENKKMPEIRFKGFIDKWERRSLGEITSKIGSGKTPKGGEAAYVLQGIPLIRSQNIYSNLVNLNNVVHINNQTHEEMGNSTVIENDVLLNITGASIGRSAVYRLKNNANVNQHVCIIRPNNGYSPDIIQLKLTAPEGQKCIDSTQAGGGREGLNFQQIARISFSFPSIAAQNRIGTFFKNLDALITLHQRKHDKLTTVKKAMLQKMFPKDGADAPEIRFKVFTDKWKKRKLEEIITEIRRPIELKDEHEYELVTVKRRNEGIISRGKLKGKDILVKTYFEIRSGDYIISKRQVVHGANGVVPQSLGKAIVSNEYLVAIGNERITTDFLALFSKLPHMYNKFFLSSYGIDIEKLVFDVDDWKKRYVFVPCLSEQQRISSFFQNLDSLITLQLRELDKLKNLKKACLEKMFV